MRAILLIDKDQIIISSITEFLEESGYRVIEADNGTRGLQMVREHHPDLIMCDLILSETDGHSLLKELNKSPETAVIPFIFISRERTNISDIRYAMSLGADDYLLKPFDKEELLKVLSIRIAKYEKITKKEEARPKKNNNRSNGLKSNGAKRRLTEEDHILLNVSNKPELVKVGSIAYITAVEEYSNVYLTQKKNLLVQRLLKEWERILPEKVFIRIHRSTIINLNQVSKMEKWFNHSYRLYLNDVPQAFVISRRYSTKIRATLSYTKI